MELARLLKYGETLGGPDKVAKITQNFAKVVAYQIAQSGNKDLADEWSRLASFTSNARKMFRFNKDIEQYGKLVSLWKKRNSMPLTQWYLSVASVLFYEIFIFFDHFLIFAKIKFMARNDIKWLRISCFGWCWSCICNALVALHKLQANLKVLQSKTTDDATRFKLLKENKEHLLSAIMNMCDAICAGSVVDYDKILTGSRITSRTYGIAGLVASSLQARQVYLK